MSANDEVTYRIRWTVPMDLVVAVTVGVDELDLEDSTAAEECAYDMAVEYAKERLEQVAVTINGVSLHGDIDGVEADEVAEESR